MPRAVAAVATISQGQPATLTIMRSLSRLTLFAVATLAPRSTAAQAPGHVPLVLELPASTRAMALGEAYPMAGRSSEAVFYQPALVQGASGFGLDLQTWSAGASAATASAAVAWFGGSVAIGLQALQYGATAADVRELPGGQDALFQLGQVPGSERGVVGKLVEEHIADERDATGAVDLGAATSVGPLTVGLTAQNLGPDMGFASGTVPLPRRFTLGVGGYTRQVGPLDVGFAGAAVTRRADGKVVAGAGLEVGYWPIIGRTFVARVGVHSVPEGVGSPFTFGFAYQGDNLVLQTAYERFADLGEATWRFGVGWR
jgi:hypothetical protein